MKGVKVKFDNCDCIVLERKTTKGSSKPKYYLFNLDKKSYISGLYPTENKSIYYFDFKADGYHFLTDNMSVKLILEKGKCVA